MSKYFLGIDQGTTGTKALLIDENWKVVSKGYKEHTQYYPKPGWVEHDPEEILNNICETTKAAIDAVPGCKASDIVSFGMDNQGETCAIWDINTGKPLYNAICWKDKRGYEFVESIKESHGDYIRKVSGLMPDACWPGIKFKWLFDNIEGLREKAARGELMAGTLETYLLWRLSGGKAFVTDVSTAGRTMLMDIRRAAWDDGLLDLCETPRSILPEIRDTSEVYAYTDPDVFLGISIPIGASQVDAHSALVAQGCVHPGDIKTAYGTGCFMNMILGDTFVESKSGLGISFPWRVKSEKSYAFGSSAFTAGSALQWLRDGLQIIENSAQSQELALSVPDSCGVVFVPAFSGLGTPYWDQKARGLFIGLTGGVTRAHITRAVLESIAFQNYDIVMAMSKDSGLPITVMKAEGGPSDNTFLMQFQSDILNIPLEIPDEKETAAYGAGFMGALATGVFDKVSDACGLIKISKRYEPKMSEDERESRLFEWHRAVERSKEWLVK